MVFVWFVFHSGSSITRGLGGLVGIGVFGTIYIQYVLGGFGNCVDCRSVGLSEPGLAGLGVAISKFLS